MAVPFYMPNQEDGDGSSSSSQSPNTSTSATQTPLQSPVTGEYLVQAICEALHRCSGSYPPSPSCSVHSPCYNGGDIFFPRDRSTPLSFSRQQQSLRSPRTSTRRSRLTSTGDYYDDDDHECHSEHETSWDELEEHHRLENFTAGRERLQEFKGRIPPRKKKKEAPKTKPKAKDPCFTWPTVVTVFVFAMGCGYLVAR
uniref:Head involution defective n=1 Tax=Megaselia scalaris TaxID=36166 RepID=A0A1L7B5I6_MEGSC|nr:head involution defective [Megaselia scalaris]